MSGTPKYILTERIAQGGMAEIHLGKIVGSDGFSRVCAFKRILPQFAQDKEFIQMFRQEAMVAKQLQNKNIVQVYDFVSDGQSFMLVMEYVDGQDLRSVLAAAEQARRRIPVEVACYLCMEVLSGLAYAHSALDVTGNSMNIIHRDISPQNVLLSYEGDIKITDFGIAKVQNTSSNTQVGVLKGKFRYMSPEQATGKDIDARSDLFAAGVILYEMITMTRLFKGEDMAVLDQVRRCNIVPPTKVRNTRIPTELEAIIMKLLAKDPVHRFQTAKAAVKELSRFLYGYRPDFFAGEVAEFMQTVFRDRLASSRERLRSTLALPVDAIGRATKGMDVVAPESLHSAVLDVSEPGLPHVAGNAARKMGSPGGPPSGSGGGRGGRLEKGSRGSRGGSPMMEASRARSLEVDVNRGTHTQSHRTHPNGSGRQGSNGTYTYSHTGLNRRGGLGGRSPMMRRNSGLKRKQGFLLFLLSLGLLAIVGGVWAAKRNLIPYSVTFDLSVAPRVPVRVDVVGSGVNLTRMIEGNTRLNLSAGEYNVRVFRPGFAMQKFSFTTSLFERNFKRSLVLEKTGLLGQLRIVTSPAGAEVKTQDGFVRATTPALLSYLQIGKKFIFHISHPKCSPYVYKDRLPRSSEKSVLTRTIRLKGCRP